MTILIATLAAIAALILWQRLQRYKRAQFIREYRLPPGLFEKLDHKRPGLTLKDKQLVAQGLRQFFLAYLNSGWRFVSMPSQVTDDLWHEFILYTRHYDEFCRRAFGRFLHHTPAIALAGRDTSGDLGLRRVWWQTCRQENINPKQPTRLPLLFALDTKLKLENGFHYTLDCIAARARGEQSVHCAGDFSTATAGGCGSGGCSGGDGGHGCSGGHGGDSGGCSGGGCGGGGD